MIKEFNISTAGDSRIYGEHYCDVLYAKNVVFHPDDIEYGVLTCDNAIISEDLPDPKDLEYNDRLYTGVLHVRDIIFRGRDESIETVV